MKKGRETFPRGVGISERKILVAGPHDQIHQCNLTDGHDLIFTIVQLKHLSFLAGQILQCPKHLTLFAAVAFLLAPILASTR